MSDDRHDKAMLWSGVAILVMAAFALLLEAMNR